MPLIRHILLGVVLASIAALMLVRDVAAQSAPDGEAIKVMSFDVSEAPAIVAPSASKPQPPSWRTSFGSERETKPEPSTAPVAGLDADIVLLQGVTNLLSLHKAFPARTWRLIVSRQMVLTDDPADTRSNEAVSNRPATAVAVRYQPGVRVAGQEHFLGRDLAGIAADAPASEVASSQPAIAGTAVRINIGGRYVWAASLSFPAGCSDPQKTCAQRESVDAWRLSKLNSGEAVISGGLWQAPAKPKPGAIAACASQSITIAPARKDAVPAQIQATTQDKFGCVAAAEAGGQAAPRKPE